MKIYTKVGDKGETVLINGQKVSKSDLRIQTYGTIDELNAVIGVAISNITAHAVVDLLKSIQMQLFSVGSDLATPVSAGSIQYEHLRIDESYFQVIEKEIDRFQEQLQPLKNFILPGGTAGASYLHLARTVCRRAERLTVSLGENVEINRNIIVYLNRLSDLFFVLARYENSVNNIPDVIWKKQ